MRDRSKPDFDIRPNVLRVGIENGAFRFAGGWQSHVIMRLRTAKHPGDEAILAFVDRARRAFTTHAAVDSLNRKFAGMGRAKAFQELISPLRLWRVAVVTCKACCTA